MKNDARALGNEIRKKEKIPHWFFLRGLTREAAHWGSFPDSFQARLSPSVVRCIDLPGSGEHFREPSPFTVGEIAEAVRKQWSDEAGAPGENFVFAISLGAMVAVEWASRYPDDISGIVLVSPSFGRGSPFYHRLSPIGGSLSPCGVAGERCHPKGKADS